MKLIESKRMGKPVLGIIPWGQQQIPQYVQNNSTELLGWTLNPSFKLLENMYSINKYI